MGDEAEGDREYSVVVNDEEQYSVWPAGTVVPAGWRPVGHTGSKADCLAYIDQVWTDMRPRSLRIRLEEQDSDTP
jgi:MbtH protein